MKNKNLKILMFNNSMEIGGAEKQLERLSTEQVNNGINLMILTRKSSLKNYQKKFKDLNIKRFSRNMILFNIQCLIFMIHHYNGFKIAHVHTLSSIAFTTLFFSSIFNKKVFLKLTRIGKNSQIDLIRKSKIKNLIFKLLIKINNPKFICLTNESLEYLNNNFYYNNNILIPNGIPVNNLKNINYKDEYIRILFVSRLISRKQVYKTILELIKFSSEKIKIIVCGDGPESKKIVKLQNLYPSLVDYRGNQNENGVQFALLESDFFIQNSLNEGLSNSFLEALSHNSIPVVSKLKFYEELKQEYKIPIFFDDFVRMNYDEKIKLKNRFKKIPRKIAMEKFNIKNTVKLLSNAYAQA